MTGGEIEQTTSADRARTEAVLQGAREELEISKRFIAEPKRQRAVLEPKLRRAGLIC